MKKILDKQNFKTLQTDEAFFYKRDQNNKLIGMIILHVDDFLIAGNEQFLRETKEQLSERFEFGSIKEDRFEFTGLNIDQKIGEISIDQNKFIGEIEPVQVNKEDMGLLNWKKQKQYRRLVGKLLWVSDITRGDIANDTRHLSTKM